MVSFSCLYFFLKKFMNMFFLILFFFCFVLDFDSGNSKRCLKLIKTRLETIRKKKNAVQKFLKNDVVDLLRNSFDYNAYGRVIIFSFYFCVHSWFLINFSLHFFSSFFVTFIFGMDCRVRNIYFSPIFVILYFFTKIPIIGPNLAYALII
jgi:hypothetical protein